MTQAHATPPGWYPQGGVERWWDGQAWGSQTRPAPQMPRKAVAWIPNRTSHAFHLIMSLLTCGLWLPIWAFMAIMNRITKRKVVTRYR